MGMQAIMAPIGVYMQGNMQSVLESVLLFLAMLAVASFIGAFLVVKFVSREQRVALRMVTQPTLTVVGMMFSVLLGFFIAQAIRDYSSANANILLEANSVGEVFRDSRGLPEVDRMRIRGLCREYVDLVIDDEWPLIAQGKESVKAQECMNRLWEASLSVTPTNVREEVIYNSYFRAMNELGAYRRVRTATLGEGMAPHLLAIIAIGAAAIVVLTFLFAPENKAFHAAILFCLLVPLTLNIFLLSEYSNPFSGIVAVVKPTMFEALKRKILIIPDTVPRYLREP